MVEDSDVDMSSHYLRETVHMIGVVVGFAIIGTVIGAGYLVARIGVLGPHAVVVMGRLAYFVLSPALLLTVLAEADVTQLFSDLLPASAIAATVCMVIYAIIARTVWKRAVPEATIGSMASGFANANNIGLPVAAYVLGDPALVVPVLLFQVVVLNPIALTVLDVSTSGRTSWKRIVTQPLRNPVIVGSMIGLTISLTGIDVPAPVMEPFVLVGAAAVPTLLLIFGMSLHGQRVLQPGTGRRDVLLAVTLKIVVMPVLAWVIAGPIMGITGLALFAIVVIAALPSAQNAFNFAVRFERAVAMSRDAVVISTALSIPSLVLVAALLAPG